MKKIVTAWLALSGLGLSGQDLKTISIDDVWQKPTFFAQGYYGLQSTKDGKHYHEIDYSEAKNKKIVKYNLVTDVAVLTLVEEQWLLLPDGKKPNIQFESFEFSTDEKKVLFYGDQEPIYRHSTRENYYIYDIATKKLSAVSDKGKQSLAGFSPDALRVAFVRDNNIYVKNVITGEEKQVTVDGSINKIINGATDWVYEEEFSFANAYAWSPDGKKLAYFRFDESEVKEYNFQKYGSLYPSDYRYKYPKAGEKNATVGIHIYDLSSGKSREVNTGPEKDQYIPRIKWTTDPNVLCVTRMNRLQNKLELLLANSSSAEAIIPVTVLLTEESKTYIEVHDALDFLDGNKEFIWMSDKDGWNHLYLYSMTGKQIIDLTQGNCDVSKYHGYNAKTGEVYHDVSLSSPTQQEVASVNIRTGERRMLSTKSGTSTAYFTSTYDYYVISHSDANTPPTADLYNIKGVHKRQVLDNDALIAKLKEYKISKKEFFKFKTSIGVELNGWMIKPKDFDPEKKYPVFMTVYGGPGANTVNNAWGGNDFFWHQMLAQKGYIIVSVDNRGTGNRGHDFKHCTYKQLGKLETEDQIEAAKYLGGLPYVEKSRIGIFGWSYGGYMASLCITKGADYFKAAIAVAPVTTWRYYDSIYTERYNGLPQDNPSGYDDNSPINFVSKIKGKYLLVHGTADDNVHFQNAVEMNAALIKANVQFESMYYPDRNHGIYGGGARIHLYNLMTGFLEKNL